MAPEELLLNTTTETTGRRRRHRRQMTVTAIRTSVVLSLLITATASAAAALTPPAAGASGNGSGRRSGGHPALSRTNPKSANGVDLFAQVTFATSPSSSRTARTRRKGGAGNRRTSAPLVDSDLLRFLGTQRKLKEDLTSSTPSASTSTTERRRTATAAARSPAALQPAGRIGLVNDDLGVLGGGKDPQAQGRREPSLSRPPSQVGGSSPLSGGAEAPTAPASAAGTADAIASAVAARFSSAAEPSSPISSAVAASASSSGSKSVVESWIDQIVPFFGAASPSDGEGIGQLPQMRRNSTASAVSSAAAAAAATMPASAAATGTEESPVLTTTEQSAAAGTRGTVGAVADNVARTGTSSPAASGPEPTSVCGEPANAAAANELEGSPYSVATATAGVAATVGDVTDSWLGQFNGHRVASILTARDSRLDEATAAKAGQRVQSQVLSRIARRRVRAFLRERDREWGVAGEKSRRVPAAAMTRSSTTREASPPPPPPASSGIDDVVDLFLSYGLTPKDVAEILIHTPGVALMRPRHARGREEEGASSNGESLEETMDRAFVGVLCGTLNLRKYDARKVLRNCPGLLTMRGSRSAEQIVTVLSKLGVSANSIARDKNALPTLLSRSPSGVFRLVAFLSSDAVRMPLSKIGPLLRRPVCQELLNAVVPVPKFGEDVSEVGATADAETVSDPGVLTALWGRSSQLRRDRINEAYRKMTNTAWTLRHEIGAADLSKVIAAYPSVLLLDAEKQILPAAKYLMNELGIWEDDLPRVLQLFPSLLGMDVSQMERVSSYLISLGVEPENLASVFRSFPALLTLDVEKDMAPVVDFLREIGIANVGRFISRLPPVLGYSVDRELKPKWEFVKTVCIDARFEVTRFPAYFSYPLERVIKTRFEYLQNEKQVPIQLVALDQVLCYGDKDFSVKVGKDDDGGKAFRVFAEQRKAKLSSHGPRRRTRQKRKVANEEK